MPGRGHLHGLVRPVVLLHGRHRLRHALHARGEVRAVIARDDRRRGRRLEVRLVQMAPTRDAVNVLVLMTCGRRLGPSGGKGFTFALRELRLSLHPAGKLQDAPRAWLEGRTEARSPADAGNFSELERTKRRPCAPTAFSLRVSRAVSSECVIVRRPSSRTLPSSSSERSSPSLSCFAPASASFGPQRRSMPRQQRRHRRTAASQWPARPHAPRPRALLPPQASPARQAPQPSESRGLQLQ